MSYPKEFCLNDSFWIALFPYAKTKFANKILKNLYSYKVLTVLVLQMFLNVIFFYSCGVVDITICLCRSISFYYIRRQKIQSLIFNIYVLRLLSQELTRHANPLVWCLSVLAWIVIPVEAPPHYSLSPQSIIWFGFACSFSLYQHWSSDCHSSESSRPSVTLMRVSLDFGVGTCSSSDEHLSRGASWFFITRTFFLAWASQSSSCLTHPHPFCSPPHLTLSLGLAL